MSIGTRSILFGAHQFILHPIILFVAWWQMYGFPSDPRLWVAFVVHDLGYWGKPNIDGPEGETHVELGARLMDLWFGSEWGDFCRYHSRFYAKRDGRQFSRLCVADKQAIVIDPWWLYLPRVWLSGELTEYMQIAAGQSTDKYAAPGKYANEYRDTSSVRRWHQTMNDYLRKWIAEHRDLRVDTWTLSAPASPAAPTAPDGAGAGDVNPERTER